jgi:hypothetical protein
MNTKLAKLREEEKNWRERMKEIVLTTNERMEKYT